MREFYTFTYYIVFYSCMRVIAYSMMEFKPRRKVACFILQTIFEMLPLYIAGRTHYFSGDGFVIDINWINIWFYLADGLILLLWAKGNWFLNLIKSFVYSQLWYVVFTVTIAIYVELLTGSARSIIECDSITDLGNVTCWILASCVSVYLSIIVWKVLKLTLRHDVIAVFVGLALAVPVIAMMASQGLDISTKQYIWNTNNEVMGIIMSILLVLLLLYLYQRFYITKSREQTLLLNTSLQSSYEYYRQIAAVSDENARWRHDIINHLQVIEQMTEIAKMEERESADTQINNSSVNEVIEYTKNILEESRTMATVGFTGNTILDCMLSLKRRTAVEQGIHIEMQIYFPKKTELSDYETVGLLSNLLDNAIEACQKEVADKRFISLKTGCRSNYLCLEMSNSCTEAIQYTEGGLLTSKKNQAQHGYGSLIVAEIVKKYDGEVHYTEEEGSLRTEVILRIA